jgi:hypothetical protein
MDDDLPTPAFNNNRTCLYIYLILKHLKAFTQYLDHRGVVVVVQPLMDLLWTCFGPAPALNSDLFPVVCLTYGDYQRVSHNYTGFRNLHI